MTPIIRAARLEDAPLLEDLIERSVMALQANDYTLEQRRGALGTVFGVDSQLIRDGTYYVTEVNSEIVACGGWSKRKTLFGSDSIAGKNDGELNPIKDAARIRAFFVDPNWARRGLGRQILEVCETAARSNNFVKFELVATLTGEFLYRTQAYMPVERMETPLPNGLTLPVVRMVKG